MCEPKAGKLGPVVVWQSTVRVAMSLFACFGGRKREVRRSFDYWDCSNLGLSDLPKEVLYHRRTLRQLTLATNNIKDVPKVRVEGGESGRRRGKKRGNEFGCVFVERERGKHTSCRSGGRRGSTLCLREEMCVGWCYDLGCFAGS